MDEGSRFRAEYGKLTPEFEPAPLLEDGEARGHDTVAVARIESGRAPPNLNTLDRYARGVGRRIAVKLVPAA